MVARLQRRTHFTHIRAHGTTVREGRLRVACAAPEPHAEPSGPAMAFAIPRSYGTAVVRNRARRRLRSIAAGLEATGRLPAMWYLVSLAPGASEPGHDQLQRWLSGAVGRLAPSDSTEPAGVRP